MSKSIHPLKILREKRKLTVTGLADLTGLSRGTIRKIEQRTSESNTNIGVAELLAEVLQCQVRDIFSFGELSHRGRPPLTGKELEPTLEVFIEVKLCLKHFVQVPVGGECDRCS